MDFIITYLSNSGFLIETAEYLFVIDYQGDCPAIINDTLLVKEKKIIFMASHGHGDHFSRKILDFADKPDCAVLLSSDIKIQNHQVTTISELQTKNVLGIPIEAYGSTDLGVSFLISLDGGRIFHAGDLNYWHWKDYSTADEVADAKSMFDQIAATIKQPIDIAFFPVDPRMGSQYDLGADLFLEMFHPKLLIPMHFRDAVSAPKDFAKKHEHNTQTEIIPLTNTGEVLTYSLPRT